MGKVIQIEVPEGMEVLMNTDPITKFDSKLTEADILERKIKKSIRERIENETGR